MGNKFYQYFIGNAPVQKTLRNELRPIGNTAAMIQKYDIVSEDSVRAEKYQSAKEIIDGFHRNFIEKSLRDVRMDWNALFLLIEEAQKNNVPDFERKLSKLQADYRKEIVKCFSNQPEFSSLFKKELICDLLPKYINDSIPEAEKEDCLEVLSWFNKFSSYFTGFHENRKNIYSADEESTAVSFRIVNENASIFYNNMMVFRKIEKDIPIDYLQRNPAVIKLLEDWTLPQIFCADYYNFLLIQTGISFYNELCGDINYLINEFCQKNKLDRRKYYLKKLHKQILSNTESSFHFPQIFETDEAVVQAVNQFLGVIREQKIKDRIAVLMSSADAYNWEHIYINAKEITFFSQKVYEDWSYINKAIHFHYEALISDKVKNRSEKIEKEIRAIKYFSLADLQTYVTEYHENNEFKKEDIKQTVYSYFHMVSEYAEKCDAEGIEWEQERKLLEEEETVDCIKSRLDSVQEILHLMKPFIIDEPIYKDLSFYAELEQILDELKPIITLYNMVRNYVTRKPYSKEKIKLNFGIPTLADGWDQNKELQNNAVLFIKDEKYYLGILNARKKPTKEQLTGKKEKTSEGDYQKIVYKLLPGPNKMLPKVFFSRKGIETFAPPTDILKKYDQGLHKKGENFDLQFCHELIDYFKSAISIHPDWKDFGFAFRDTKSYNDISEFYREIAEQGYKISFEYFGREEIENLVNDEKMFLFQIYNKDFADGRKMGSRDNLHTMFLKQLFSEDNLKDVVFKLNGQAEVFYRKASISNPIVHKQGEKVLNKTYLSEEDGIRLPVPENVYVELSQYYNDRGQHLSPEAEKFKDKVTVKEVKYDIIKDRRYSCDKFFFHMPITINYKAEGRANVNMIAQRYVADNFQQMNVIGIDRGERNLLYVSVINPKGQILEQKSYNVIGHYDYQAKLTDKERARNDSRRNWKSIGTIKEIKEGYLSLVIHEIIQLMMQYNAVIVMENLNSGFKNGRKKVERQVYQKFETMLIDKMNYIVFKDRDAISPGGVLKGYQMTFSPDTLSMVGKQCGMIFYVPPAYTSKIDPTTGFVDIFDYNKYASTNAGRKRFLSMFKSIQYDGNLELFKFTFDYRDFRPENALAIQEWTVYANGERIIHIGEHHEKSKTVIPQEMLEKAFTAHNIEYLSGRELLDDIRALDEKDDKVLINEIFYAFKTAMQMRNFISNETDVDYIISPVQNKQGVFFVSESGNGVMLPENADANGAYHIALKGLYLITQIKEKYQPDQKIDLGKIDMSHKTWFDYVQNRRFEESDG